jgi:hypothetical protein
MKKQGFLEAACSFSRSTSVHTSLNCARTHPVSCDVHCDSSHPNVQFQDAAWRRLSPVVQHPRAQDCPIAWYK